MAKLWGRMANDARTTRSVLLFGILVWGLGLRAYLAPLETPWYDEVLTLENLDAATITDYLGSLQALNSPTQPAYFSLLYGWSRVFGTHYVAARYLSIVLGELSLVLVYLIGREVRDPWTGLIAALALASAHVHIEYSLETRMYMLTLVCALASVYSLLKLIAGPSAVWMAVHLASTVGLVWSHAFGVFLLPAEAVAWVIWGPRRMAWQLGWVAGQFAASGSLAVWFLGADRSQIQGAMDWLPTPHFWAIPGLGESFRVSVVGTWYSWLASARASEGVRTVVNLVPTLFYGGLIAFVIGTWIRELTQRLRATNGERDTSPSRSVPFLLLWWTLPCLIAYTVSHVWRPVFFPRYLLYCSVPPYLFVGYGVSWPHSRAIRRTGTCATVALALWLGFVNAGTPQRPPWVQAIDAIESSGDTESNIALYCNSAGLCNGAVRTIEYLRPKWAPRVKQALTADQVVALLPRTTGPDATYVVVVSSGPVPEMEGYLTTHGFRYVITPVPARDPLTIYRIEVAGD